MKTEKATCLAGQAESYDCLPMEPHEILRAAKIKADALPYGGVVLMFPKVRTPWAALVSAVILAYMIGLSILVAPEMTWEDLPVFLGALAMTSIAIPVLWLFSWCRRPRWIEIKREGVSLPGGLVRLGVQRRLRFDEIVGIAVAPEGDIMSRTSEVYLVTRGVPVLVADRLSYPADLAVQRVLETAIRDYAGKAT